MNRSILYKDSNELYFERYELATERIKEFANEEADNKFYDYFKDISEFTALLDKVATSVINGSLTEMSVKELKELNQKVYSYISEDNYTNGFCDTDYACKKLGKSFGILLSKLFSDLYSLVYEAFCGNLEPMTLYFEHVIEIYGMLKEGDVKASQLKKAMYYFMHDYCYEFTKLEQKRRKCPASNDILSILVECDLNKPDYLYYYGAYIGENELGIWEYLKNASEEIIEKVADTFVGGYVRGFAAAGIDFSERKNVEIRYPVGFERIVLSAVKKFQNMGKSVIMYMDESRRVGTSGVLPNRQFAYDHRNDKVFFFDKRYVDVKKECIDKVYSEIKDDLKVFAGPACMETFGEKNFKPVNKETVLTPGDKENKLATEMRSELSIILRKYVDMEKVSFTIIAYPLPDIGDNFEEIFTATNAVNTLDNDLYCTIQQNIIDVLDKGDYVLVKGKGSNKTELKVMLHELKNPEKETNFENCTADVNIPVGEVFTSPVLKGTSGKLNVSHAFLEGYEYKNLTIDFEDGMIKSYSCDNFETEEENKKYIYENILFRHETLPIGEFAIGTNTTAYKMAGDFDVWDKLPILIAEKTGPHFAVGDTCYSDMEDFMTYNPDGKAIIARENEVSALRKVDRAKAYLNCHTDITIPYDELDYIRVNTPEGLLSIIEDGKFAVKNTEVLNDYL